MIGPEHVQAPAGHVVLFRSAPVRTFLVLFVILLVTYVTVSPLVELLLGDTGDPWWATVLQGAVIGLLVSGGYASTARSAVSTWVRVSDGGLELAADGSDPVLLTWPDIDTAVVHRDGLRTVLDVKPVDLDRVHPVQGEDEGWPAIAETELGTAFTADLTQVWPGPRALRRELARHLHS